MDAFRAELLTGRWKDAESSARRLAQEGALAAFPTAHDYAAWTDEQLAALRVDLEDALEDDADDEEWDDESVPTVDTHPVNRAVEAVTRAQRVMREAEAAGCWPPCRPGG